MAKLSLYPTVPSPRLSASLEYTRQVLTHSAAFRQQKQLVYGTLDSQNDLQRAIVQVSNDVKSAEAVSPFPTSNILSPILYSIRANRVGQAVGHYLILNHSLAHLAT